MFGAIISLITNFLFNLIFMQFLGVGGIALSTALVYLVAFLYLSAMLRRQLSIQGASNAQG
jgi:putative peptidoglycan lipid II flippase